MGIKKTVTWISGILLISLIGLGIFVFFKAQEIVNSYVKENLIEEYNHNPEVNYSISFERINLDLFNGGVKLINVKVMPKDSLITLFSNLNHSLRTNTFFRVSIKEIALAGFNFDNLINNRMITAKRFQILDPSISVYTFDGLPKPTDSQQDTLDLRSIFLTNFDTFQLDLVDIENAAIRYSNVSTNGDTSTVFAIENLSYSFQDVIANNSTLFSDHYFEYGLFKLNSKKISSMIGDKASVSIGAITYSSKTKQLLFKDIDFDPKQSPNNFFKSRKYRKAWIKFHAAEIQLNELSLDYWLANNQVRIKKVNVRQPKLTVHTNSNLPLHPSENKLLLGEMLTQINVAFMVEEIAISKGELVMDMMGKLTDNHAKLKLKELEVTAYNATNIPTEIKKNNQLEIHASANPMNAGKVNTDITIDLADSRSLTQLNMHGSNLKLKNFNEVTAPMVRITIRDGEMVNLNVKSTISTSGAIGTMDAHYENLKLQMEKKELTEAPKFLENAISSIANGYLKNDNIPNTKHYRTGKINFEKQPSDSFFKLIWLVVINGMEDSILGSENRDKKKLKQDQKPDRSLKLHLDNNLFKNKK